MEKFSYVCRFLETHFISYLVCIFLIPYPKAISEGDRREKISENNQIWPEKLFIFCLSLWGT